MAVDDLVTALPRPGSVAARVAVATLPPVAVLLPGLAAGAFFVGAGLLTLAVVRRNGFEPWRRAVWVWPGAAAVLLGLASAAWSPVPERTATTALNLALLIVPACTLLLAAGQERLRDHALPLWAAGGLAAALALVAGETVARAAGASSALATVKGYTFLALWVWPVAGALWLAGRRHLATAAMIAVTLASFASEADLSWTATLVGGIALVCAAAAPVATVRVAALLLFAYAVVLPFALGWLPAWKDDLPSALVAAASGRIDIWGHLSTLGWERPVLGWGLQASGVLPPIPAVGPPSAYHGVQASYPHNVPLQVRLELGIAGLAVLAAILLAAWRAIRALPRTLVPFTLAFTAGALWVSCISYNLWSDFTLFLYLMPITLFGLLADDGGAVDLAPGRHGR